MSSISVLTGVFRIGRDAELRYLPSGEAVINLSLAYNYGKRDGEGKQATQWVEAGLWGSRAEKLAQHLLKGTEVWALLSDVHISTFNKADGSQGFKLAARVQDLSFTGAGSVQGERQPRPPQPQGQQQAPRNQAKPAAPAGKAPASGFDDMDDDIPF